MMPRVASCPITELTLTTLAPCARASASSSWRVSSKTARTSTRITASQALPPWVLGGPTRTTPALFTSEWTGPRPASSAAVRDSAASSARSQQRTSASPPAASIEAATAASASASVPRRATWWPSRARRLAMAAPIPRLAPVTTARRAATATLGAHRAVEDDRRPGEVGRGVEREVGGEVRDLLGPCVAARGDRRLEGGRGAERVRQGGLDAAHHRGGDAARADGVHRDAAARELRGDRAGQSHDRVLGRAVGGQVGGPGQAGARGDVDDAAVAPGAEVGDDRLQHADHGEHVHVEDALDLGERRVLDRTDRSRDAGVVDDGVETAEPVARGV